MGVMNIRPLGTFLVRRTQLFCQAHKPPSAISIRRLQQRLKSQDPITPSRSCVQLIGRRQLPEYVQRLPVQPPSSRSEPFIFRTEERRRQVFGASLSNRRSPPQGVTVAQVFEAVRRVRLPGGEIGVEPGVRGLANLQSFFWVEGVEQPPVDLEVGGSTVHAEFRVLEYQWTFGDGEPLVTRGPGSPGLESEVRTTFARRGFYRVGVTVMWAAEAYLDGRRVGEVDDLVSRAETTYPVAELRTVLTG